MAKDVFFVHFSVYCIMCPFMHRKEKRPVFLCTGPFPLETTITTMRYEAQRATEVKENDYVQRKWLWKPQCWKITLKEAERAQLRCRERVGWVNNEQDLSAQRVFGVTRRSSEKPESSIDNNVLLLKAVWVAWRSSDSQRHTNVERKSSEKPE